MLKHSKQLKVSLVLLFGILLFCSSAFVQKRYTTDNDGVRHYYRDGRWYKNDSTGNEIVVNAIAVGTCVESLPLEHTTVVIQSAPYVIQSTPYYYDKQYYYAQLPKGNYVVVGTLKK